MWIWKPLLYKITSSWFLGRRPFFKCCPATDEELWKNSRVWSYFHLQWHRAANRCVCFPTFLFYINSPANYSTWTWYLFVKIKCSLKTCSDDFMSSSLDGDIVLLETSEEPYKQTCIVAEFVSLDYHRMTFFSSTISLSYSLSQAHSLTWLWSSSSLRWRASCSPGGSTSVPSPSRG